MDLKRKIFAEFLGTAGLLAIVVGSGIMGEKLAAGNAAVALLANSLATGAGLAFLILSLGTISGHFNPVVTFTETLRGGLSWRILIIYSCIQICGAIVGVITANTMFDLQPISISVRTRTGFSQWLSEFIAAFGLIGVIRTAAKFHPKYTALTVAAYITSAYWFTGSTSFANPAVTVARSLSNTFTGIRPSDILPFIVSQILGVIVATFVFNWLLEKKKQTYSKI